MAAGPGDRAIGSVARRQAGSGGSYSTSVRVMSTYGMSPSGSFQIAEPWAGSSRPSNVP
jgi:hypothetical protein